MIVRDASAKTDERLRELHDKAKAKPLTAAQKTELESLEAAARGRQGGSLVIGDR